MKKQEIAISASGEMYIDIHGEGTKWVHIVDKRIKKAIARIYGFKSWQLKP